MDKIIENGFDEATIVVGYFGEKIKDYIHSNYSIRVDFVEQEERLGLGHAIYLSRNTVSRDPILIILGDTIFDVNLRAMMEGPDSVIGVKEVDDPRRFGVAEVADGYITKLVEKPQQPKSNLAVIGLYYITRPQVLIESLKEIIRNNVKTKGEFQLTDALQVMLQKGEKMRTFEIDGWYDCGKPETLLSTNRYLLEAQKTVKPPPDVVIHPPVFLSPKAKVKNSVLGPHATVAQGAVVENSIIRNSIISEEAEVKDALLEDSIVGSCARVRGSYKRINIGDSSELEFY
jgi:glucose-1-phosphate thymidylyltransferase